MRVPDLAHLLPDERLLRFARTWCVVLSMLLAFYWHGQLRLGWTDGVDRPFGEDFLNFWSAARLAASGSVGRIYDVAAFHAFQVDTVGHGIDLYHYSYPPVAALLTMPLGQLPYPIAWGLWQAGGWCLFALTLRRIVAHWAVFALAWPAVFVNALGGQIGCWIAAIVGWGLLLLPRRPVVAGLILSLLIIKPQLGWLVPLALLAGREWRALAAMAGGAGLLLLAATLWFGPGAWLAYAAQAAMLKRVILEDGYGTWYRMISTFVLLRHLPAPLPIAYAGQALASLAVAVLVVRVWARRSLANGLRGPVLLVGLLTGSLYVSDYDCVLLALAAAWSWPTATPAGRMAIALATATPILTAGLAHATHVAVGALLLWPMLLWATRQAFDQAALSMPRSPSLR